MASQDSGLVPVSLPILNAMGGVTGCVSSRML